MKTFLGIDFANVGARHASCWLEDDGTRLNASFERRDAPTLIAAIDCPFGTSIGFQALLAGGKPDDMGNDQFKSRATERFMRKHVAEFLINRRWRALDAAEKRSHGRDFFFNGGAHVQPSVGLVIVPGFLSWFATSIAPQLDPPQRLDELRAARRGETTVVEAHPRLFLYSALEHINRHDEVPASTLASIAGYKGKGIAGEHGRERAVDLLMQPRQSSWLNRTLTIDNLDHVISIDHAFDALLCALTAWSHHQRKTLTWQEAGIDLEVVNVEGHIHILKT